jgi:hypothetical protein
VSAWWLLLIVPMAILALFLALFWISDPDDD